MKTDKQIKKPLVVHPATLNYLAEQTWTFAKGILWQDVPVSSQEINACIYYLKQYYELLLKASLGRKIKKHFMTLCEKILDMRHLLDTRKVLVLAPPSIWLNPVNPNGIRRSKPRNRKVSKKSIISKISRV